MTTVPTNQAFNTHYGKIKNNNTEHLIQHVVQQNNVTLFNFSISGVDVTDGLLSVTCDTVTGDQVIYSLDLEDDRAELSTDIYNYAVGGTVEIFLSVVWNLYLTVAEVDYDDIPEGEDSEAIALLQARIKKLEKDLKDAQDDLAEAEDDLVATAALLSDAEDDLSAAQSQLGACQENNTTLTGQLSTCQSNNSTLQAQVTQLEADLAAAQQSSGSGGGGSQEDYMIIIPETLNMNTLEPDNSWGQYAVTITDNTLTQMFVLAQFNESSTQTIGPLIIRQLEVVSVKIEDTPITSLNPSINAPQNTQQLTYPRVNIQIRCNDLSIPVSDTITVELKLRNKQTDTVFTYNMEYDIAQGEYTLL